MKQEKLMGLEYCRNEALNIMMVVICCYLVRHNDEVSEFYMNNSSFFEISTYLF